MQAYWPILLRVAVTFATLLLLTRLTGKKQLSQITFFDFITAIAIGDIAGEKLSDPDEPLLPWLAGTAFWFALTLALDWLVIRSRRFGKLVEGEPAILIENGRIRQRALKKNHLRVDDLMSLLRQQGYFNPADVEFAVFETDGNLSVLAKSQKRPVTPEDLRLPTHYEGITREVIFEGEPIEQNLKAMGLNRSWLEGELQRQGYFNLRDVFYAALDTHGKLYVDGYQDIIPGAAVKVQDYDGPH